MNFGNPLLVIGLIMLGMALGALLTRAHYKRNLRLVMENLLTELGPDLYSASDKAGILTEARG